MGMVFFLSEDNLKNSHGREPEPLCSGLRKYHPWSCASKASGGTESSGYTQPHSNIHLNSQWASHRSPSSKKKKKKNPQTHDLFLFKVQGPLPKFEARSSTSLNMSWGFTCFRQTLCLLLLIRRKASACVEGGGVLSAKVGPEVGAHIWWPSGLCVACLSCSPLA